MRETENSNSRHLPSGVKEFQYFNACTPSVSCLASSRASKGLGAFDFRLKLGPVREQLDVAGKPVDAVRMRK